MQIVVNHLTRMKTGNICVAGISMQSHQHIRPRLDFGQLTEAMWTRNGGVFDIGVVVDLGNTRNRSEPPQVEDRIFQKENLALVQHMALKTFWDLLLEQSKQSFEDIFGPELQQVRRSYATEEGRGQASLGCFIPPSPPKLYIDHNYGKVKMDVQNGNVVASMTVVDRRLCDDQHNLRTQLVDKLAQRIMNQEPIVLSLGLARAFTAQNDDRPRHWLQVNNIHLEGSPKWTEHTL